MCALMTRHRAVHAVKVPYQYQHWRRRKATHSPTPALPTAVVRPGALPPDMNARPNPAHSCCILLSWYQISSSHLTTIANKAPTSFVNPVKALLALEQCALSVSYAVVPTGLSDALNVEMSCSSKFHLVGVKIKVIS